MLKSDVLTTDAPTDKNSSYISSLRKEIEYLREENRAEMLIIKQLTEIKTTVNPNENPTDKTTRQMNNKVNEVNRRLVLMCKERNISFLSHDESINPSKHLNESKLHLNSKSIRFLVKLNLCQQRKTNLNTSISLDLDKTSHNCETPNKGSTKSAQTDDPKEILKNLRLKNVNRLLSA